ncbi:hypothetical protein IHE45_15G056400 [Dioscorea alata]|uniref:Uncharacterized protein n=1 Tax=Dioscorea alata TaxID=55571 RepID=A0ACB7ULL0_DIOAL|nr:hypothetical protein IHE45_15G056400 [Dioscorea alata]
MASAPSIEGQRSVRNTPMHGYNYITREHKVDMDEPSWIKTVRTKLNEVRPRTQVSRPWAIFKVPDNIRRNETKTYDPFIASIGPYHYRASQRGTTLAMQNHKWRCVRWLLSRHQSRQQATLLLDKCLLAMKALDVEVRSCYSEDIYYLDPHKLASIMLLDGCFIIHLLLKQVTQKAEKVIKHEEKDEDKEKKVEDEQNVELDVEGEEEIEGPLLGMQWIWNLVLYDLLKLENQIPFFVIETLFDILRTTADESIDLPKLTLQLFSGFSLSSAATNTKSAHHLLHLFHQSLIPSDDHNQLYLAHTQMVNEWIPSATKLRLAGIKFAKKNTASSFLDLSYKNGAVEIPEIFLYDYNNTYTLFRNLIGFEQCYPGAKSYISSYTNFMNCIIDGPKDVHLLELKGIIINQLRPQDSVCSSDDNYLHNLLIEVKKYTESRWHKWTSGLMERLFQ